MPAGFTAWLVKHGSGVVTSRLRAIIKTERDRSILDECAARALKSAVRNQQSHLTDEALEAVVSGLRDVLWGRDDSLPFSPAHASMWQRLETGITARFAVLDVLEADLGTGSAQAEEMGLHVDALAHDFVEGLYRELEEAALTRGGALKDLWHVMSTGRDELNRAEIRDYLAVVARWMTALEDRAERSDTSLLAGLGPSAHPTARGLFGSYGAPDGGRLQLGVPTGFRPSYRPTLNAFAERHAQLLEREQDLAQLIHHVLEGGYLVLEGDAWAGKTAIVTHLATALERVSCRVVRFYVVGDSASRPGEFFAAVNVQLLDIAGASGGVARTRDSQAMQFGALWDHLLRSGEGRLVLLVDGLDEQDPADPISRYLPPSCPAYASVVVTTRNAAEVAGTVAAYHALSGTGSHARYRLAPSRHALASEREAHRAISGYLESGDVPREDIVALLTFGRGPFSVGELAELAGIPPGRCEQHVRGLRRQLRETHDYDEEARYAFGHVELDRQARAWFGQHGEETYTGRILEWAATYAGKGWPATTPWYLVRSLDHLLAESPIIVDRLERLRNLVNTDRARLLSTRLNHEQPMLGTIDAAIRLLRSQEPFDRVELFRLVLAESDSRSRMGLVPSAVLVALGVTGRSKQAIEIARAMSSPHRSDALYELTVALVEHDSARAFEAAYSITDYRWRDRALRQVVEATASANAEQALRLTEEITVDGERTECIATIAAAMVEDEPEQALALVMDIADDSVRFSALTVLAGAAMSHHPMLALNALRAVTNTEMRAAGLVDLAIAVGSRDIADEALVAVRAVADGRKRVKGLGHLAVLLGSAELADEALEAVRAAPGTSFSRAWDLVDLAHALRSTGVAGEALRTLHPITKPERLDRLWRALDASLIGLATVLESHDPECALDVARAVAGHGRRAEVVAQLSVSLGRPYLVDEALDIARTIGDAGHRAWALAQVATALQRSDVGAEAFHAARSITLEGRRAPVLAQLASRLDSREVAEETVALATAIGDVGWRDQALPEVAIALADRYPELAIEACHAIVGADKKAKMLAEIARILIRPDLTDEALQLARTTSSDSKRPWAMNRLAVALVQLDPAGALRVARAITDARLRAWALARLAQALHRPDIADESLGAARVISYDPNRAGTLAQLSTVLERPDAAQEAIHAARVLAKERLRAYSLAEVAEALRRSDIAEEAVDAASPNEQAGMIARLAASLADAAPERAIEWALTLANEWQRAEALTKISVALAELDPRRALVAARAIPIDSAQAQALTKLAVTLRDPDLADEAMEAMRRSTTEGCWRLLSMAELAAAFARTHLAHEALETTRSIPDTDLRVRVLGRLAAILRRSDVADEALKSARVLVDDGLRLEVMAHLAAAFRRADVADETLATARSLPDTAMRSLTMVQVAAAFAKEDPERSLAVAMAISEVGYRDEALTRLAEGLAEQDADAALNVARAISDDARRAEILVRIATGLGTAALSLVAAKWTLESP